MNKGDLVKVIVNKTDNKLTKDEADDLVGALLSKMTTSLLGGEIVRLYTIGSLQLYQGNTRRCRNICKGEWIQIPPKLRVRFKISPVLKRRLAKMDATNATLRKNGVSSL